MSAKAKRSIIIVSIIAALLIVVIAGFLIVASAAKNGDKIFPNVYISGIDVGGMTREEAIDAVNAADVSLSQDIVVVVVLTDDVEIRVTGEDVGYAKDTEGAVDMAFNCGRSDNFFANVVGYIKCMFKSSDITESSRNVDAEKIKAIVSEYADQVNTEEGEKAYTIEDDRIIITKGIAAYIVDEDAVCKYIQDVFSAGKSGEFKTTEFSKAEAAADSGALLDLDALHAEVFTEAKDAAYDAETGTFTQEVVGVDFDLEAAKKAYDAAADGDTVIIDLIITEPKVKAEDLEGAIFRDCLAEKTTSMSTSTSNRINNIKLAAEAINGTILNPGDEFSFNGIVGERTAAKGYKPAGAYVGGESVDQIGGGICQVSSTIYYCTLKAGLEITSRANHMFSVAYLPLGFDATVNWGTIDFKFKNNQDFPIKIVASVENKSLTVELWGTKLDDNYIELEYELLETISYDEIEKEDETLAPGERKVKTSGHLGYVVNSYYLVYDGDGNLISRNFIAKSTYRKQDRVILVGPAEETPDPGEETGGEVVDPPVDPTDPGGEGTPIDPGDTDPVDPGSGATDPDTGENTGTDAPVTGDTDIPAA